MSLKLGLLNTSFLIYTSIRLLFNNDRACLLQMHLYHLALPPSTSPLTLLSQIQTCILDLGGQELPTSQPTLTRMTSMMAGEGNRSTLVVVTSEPSAGGPSTSQSSAFVFPRGRGSRPVYCSGDATFGGTVEGLGFETKQALSVRHSAFHLGEFKWRARASYRSSPKRGPKTLDTHAISPVLTHLLVE